MEPTVIEFVQESRTTCEGCGTPTRGRVVFGAEDRYALCPRCRDTQSTFLRVTGRERKLFKILSASIRSDTTNVPLDMQIPPQLSRALKEVRPANLIPRVLSDKRWVVAEKFDGVRAMAYFVDGHIFYLSRNKSKGTGSYADKSDNLPHLDLNIPELNGTVLDGELIFTGDYILSDGREVRSTSVCTSSIVNAGPLKAKQLQQIHGMIAFVLFDIPIYKGEDLRDQPLGRRRPYLTKVWKELHNRQPLFRIEELHVGEHADKEALYDSVVANGGEGLMYKDVTAPYSRSATSRPLNWIKRKKRQTIDGYIIDYTPGEVGFKGLVGALVIAVTGENGEPFHIASVTNLPLSLREEISDPEGKLKDRYYKQVVEVEFQELTDKSHRGRHATLLRWRPDKDWTDCTIESLLG